MRYLILVLTLSSCAIFEPRIITKEVKVPVSVPCVKSIPEKPPHFTGSLLTTDSIHDKVKALLLDNNALNADNLQLRAILEGCVI